ncbi:MAG: sterol desaturase family protein [Saprospiraceae bacterium]|nr:sterol desaturase family protein [Saprospiraceae bacterium]
MLYFTEVSPERWLLVPLLIFGRYALLCGWLFGLFYVWKRRAWWYRKIQQRFPQTADYYREISHSALTALIFAAVGWLLLGTSLRQYTRLYTEVQSHGLGYLLLSVVLVVLLHDTYFYWIHRLMHLPWLYRHVHRVHHQSVNPSPWAAYSFHPLEAMLEAGILPLAVFLIPLHPIALFSFVTLMLWFNVYGHLGYELFPRQAYRHPVARWLNSAVFHNLHHERFQGNYCLYFSFWDRWMGTLHRDNEQRVAALHDQIEHAETAVAEC